MADFPTGYQVYHALVKLLQAGGVADAKGAVDVTLVPEGQTATYTVVPTERAKAALADTLTAILGRSFATDEMSWVLEQADVGPILQAAGS